MQNRDPLTPTEKHIYSPTNRQEFRRKYNILIVRVKIYKKNIKWVSDTVNSMVVQIVWFKKQLKNKKNK
jgi:hypothetical protein